MKIRSITCFTNPRRSIWQDWLKTASRFLQEARPAFEQAGYEVQTARLATTPFPEWLGALNTNSLPEISLDLERSASQAGFEYLSLGPALSHHPESYAVIPEAIAATQSTFFSGMLTTSGNGVSLPAARACAEIIQAAAGITVDGFANLRFAALANVTAGAPFFPAAYHSGENPSFALASEAADLVVEAFDHASSLEAAQKRLIDSLEKHAATLERVSTELARKFGLMFGGIDFTPAPFPEEPRSLATALEGLGLPAMGLHGSLAASALLTSSLDRARYPRIGFNGLMLPVLEDATLAKRAAEGVLSVKDLLLFSSVCGTGLDTIPLPGDTASEQITPILLDLAALALRLGKPLTARLMPIPGKIAGDATDFEFAYFANSRVMRLESASLAGLLNGNETFTVLPYRDNHPTQT